ncbi:MAG: T9SS type A sorting domain-containing protein, partial [Bacteroidota bacterium]
MKNLVFLFILALAVHTASAQQVNITFELNTQLITPDAGGIFLAGGAGFGVAGDNPMTDPDGDGIYTVTVQRDQGFSSFYTFLNGFCPDFSCKENIGGLPCSNPNNYNDRLLPPVMSDTTILACFGTCDFDGSCSVVLDSIELTFQLNTENIDPDPTGIFIAGGNNFGIPGDFPMIDPDGDGIYTITVTKPLGFSSFYTFTNGNCPDFSCKENLEGLPCANPDAYNDRFISGVMSDTTILACFGNCADDGSCVPASVRNLVIDENLFTIAPTVVSDFVQVRFNEGIWYQNKRIEMMDSTGIILMAQDARNYSAFEMDTSTYPSGIYMIRVLAEEKLLTKRFII